MKCGFSFKVYDTEFTNCFVLGSKYDNGNLCLNLFGFDPNYNKVRHFADISLDLNKRKLKSNEVIVDYLYKDNFIKQLKDLDIIKEQTGVCAGKSAVYPIYTVDCDDIIENRNCVQELIAA